MLAQSHYLSLTSWRGLRQHLMPGCHLPSAPIEIGRSIFSSSEFPRGSYAYTSPLKAEGWRRGPEDSLPVPTWLLVVTDTGWHAWALLASVLMDMLGEGMGQSQAPTQTSLVPAVPTCPMAACSGSQTGESCSHRSLLLLFMLGCKALAQPWAVPTPEFHSGVFWGSRGMTGTVTLAYTPHGAAPQLLEAALRLLSASSVVLLILGSEALCGQGGQTL